VRAACHPDGILQVHEKIPVCFGEEANGADFRCYKRFRILVLRTPGRIVVQICV